MKYYHVLRSVQYALNKIENWSVQEREEYLAAYDDGNWDTVYKMTEDLNYSQLTNSICREQIFSMLNSPEYLDVMKRDSTKVP